MGATLHREFTHGTKVSFEVDVRRDPSGFVCASSLTIHCPPHTGYGMPFTPGQLFETAREAAHWAINFAVARLEKKKFHEIGNELWEWGQKLDMSGAEPNL